LSLLEYNFWASYRMEDKLLGDGTVKQTYPKVKRYLKGENLIDYTFITYPLKKLAQIR
jgi:hypothetical protein